VLKFKRKFLCLKFKWLKKRVAHVHPEITNTWLLHHDNAPSLVSLLVREFLAKQTVAMLPQPPYSPDLATPDFFLFPRLKSSLKGHHFGTVKNVQAAVTNALKEIPVQDFQASYNTWQNRWQQCIDVQGCYFEEY
jgi:transposase